MLPFDFFFSTSVLLAKAHKTIWSKSLCPKARLRSAHYQRLKQMQEVFVGWGQQLSITSAIAGTWQVGSICLPLGLADRFSWQIAPPDICDSECFNSISRLLASVGTRLFPRIEFVWVLPWPLWIELVLEILGMQRAHSFVSLCCSINVLCSFVGEDVHNHLDRVEIVNRKCPCTYCTCVLLGSVLPFPLVSWCCYVVYSWIRWFETVFVLLFFGPSLC